MLERSLIFLKLQN